MGQTEITTTILNCPRADIDILIIIIEPNKLFDLVSISKGGIKKIIVFILKKEEKPIK